MKVKKNTNLYEPAPQPFRIPYIHSQPTNITNCHVAKMGRNSGKCAWCGNNVSTKRANSYLKTPVWCRRNRWVNGFSNSQLFQLQCLTPTYPWRQASPRNSFINSCLGCLFCKFQGVCCILRLHGDASSKGYLRGLYVLPADMDMAWKRSPSFGVEIRHRLCRTW